MIWVGTVSNKKGGRAQLDLNKFPTKTLTNKTIESSGVPSVAGVSKKIVEA